MHFDMHFKHFLAEKIEHEISNQNKIKVKSRQ